MSNNEEKEYRIGNQILRQSDITKKFTKDGLEWEFEIPNPILKREIERLISMKIGVPAENYDRETYALVKACVYVDNVCINTPNDWDSAEECRDEELIFEIYVAFMDFENEFRRSLKSGKFKGNRKKP